MFTFHMKRTLSYLFFFFLTLVVQAQKGIPYDLKNPIDILSLPKYLEEVSGLTYYSKEVLAMLNDEKGNLYLYDLRQKEIINKARFKGKGDFEGIERVDDHIYAVKSNGDLYRFQVEKEGVVEEIETPFDDSHDIEGLAYDPFKHQLLFALKGSGDVGNFDVKGKAIYAYDLVNAVFIEAPEFVILNKELEDLVDDDFDFRPSGLAVHPISKELYVLSASDRALLRFDLDGRPISLNLLSKKHFPQPEGITFSPSGKLFISSERKGKGGTILVFEYQRNNHQ